MLSGSKGLIGARQAAQTSRILSGKPILGTPSHLGEDKAGRKVLGRANPSERPCRYNRRELPVNKDVDRSPNSQLGK
jgi:hypothetical protein